MQPLLSAVCPLSREKALLACAVLAVLAAAGCGPREPQFVSRAEVGTLIPEAQQYVHELLEQNYGTPTNSVAWERLPVRYHAATGSVAAVPSETQIQLQPPSVAGEEEPEPGAFEQWLEIRGDGRRASERGMEVLVVSGPLLQHTKTEEQAGRTVPAVRVRHFNAQTYTLELSAPLPVSPQPGDRVIIGPGEMLKRGRLLYAEHCQHCHGVSGDGEGPTARYLNPRPRDYRAGIFKFTSTATPNRATREDLAHTIEEGIPGTYMPSFKLLTPEESAALVEYVLWLACRGETELKRTQVLALDFTQEAAREDPAGVRQSFAEAFETQFPNDFDEETSDIASKWQEAEEESVAVFPKSKRPPISLESIARGREIFRSETAKCATCHGEAGKGDGPQTLLVQKDPQGRDRDTPGLFDDWGNPIQPRNLTTGIYRGGRRPIDIYRRIYAGIKGTPMTGFGTSLTDEQIWDLVNYVMSMPFEQHRPGSGPFVPGELPGGNHDSGVAQVSPISDSTTGGQTP